MYYLSKACYPTMPGPLFISPSFKSKIKYIMVVLPILKRWGRKEVCILDPWSPKFFRGKPPAVSRFICLLA